MEFIFIDENALCLWEKRKQLSKKMSEQQHAQRGQQQFDGPAGQAHQRTQPQAAHHTADHQRQNDENP